MSQVFGQKNGGQKDDPFFCPPFFCQIPLSPFWRWFADWEPGLRRSRRWSRRICGGARRWPRMTPMKMFSTARRLSSQFRRVNHGHLAVAGTPFGLEFRLADEVRLAHRGLPVGERAAGAIDVSFDEIATVGELSIASLPFLGLSRTGSGQQRQRVLPRFEFERRLPIRDRDR